METSAYIALSRQTALRRQMAVVANNLANMNTPAFKGQNMMFVEHVVKSQGNESFTPTKLSYTRDISQFTNLSEGPVLSTGNNLDIAIKGDGYFVIEAPDQELYTRNGRFQLDTDGQLVSQQGFPVLSDAGTPLIFGPTDTEITIAKDGTISTNNGDLGRIRIVTFEDEQRLKREAGGLYSSEQEPEDAETTVLVQGALEGSNVEPILELTKMIETHRAFDSTRKLIDREDNRQKQMIQKLGPRG